ncbi:hypothetical protein [Rhizobium leguminosarum]|uniref:hypothetical protein n=1 Tax=Rhizobium leguminosarum TaxID=384 RepID=UPI003F9B6668
MTADVASVDAKYRETLLEPIRVCAHYRPKFGIGNRDEEISLDAFTKIFGSDPLYSWIGLNSPLMYAAHKAAGGMTSIYRQVGIGCERLVRAIVQEQLGLSDSEVRWGYDVTTGLADDQKTRRLTLDARIDRDHVKQADARRKLDDWTMRVKEYVGIRDERQIRGAVFEVRQGYKSADSKRQNADLAFGIRARDEGYLPIIMVVSNQVSNVVAGRYRDAQLLVLTGTLSDDDRVSTFAFFEAVLGYSLPDFFRRNTSILREEMALILEGLLSPSV